MQQFLTLLLSFSLFFAVGIGISRAYFFLVSRPNRKAQCPVDNAKVTMKTRDALYRCRLISQDSSGWTFSAPMHRDNYVPVAVGEEVICEVVAHGGLITFPTKVISRKPIEGTILVASPKNVKLDNRRTKADRREVEMDVIVGGRNGEVIDISSGGARVKIQGFEREGNMVKVDLPTGESRGATVVDSKNDHLGSVVRLKFDEPIGVDLRS